MDEAGIIWGAPEVDEAVEDADTEPVTVSMAAPVDLAAAPVVAMCRAPGCGKPTWNGLPDEYCSVCVRGAMCLALGCGKPTWSDYGYCGSVCKAARQAPPATTPVEVSLVTSARIPPTSPSTTTPITTKVGPVCSPACATSGCKRTTNGGYPTCCVTCTNTGGAGHGPNCDFLHGVAATPTHPLSKALCCVTPGCARKTDGVYPTCCVTCQNFLGAGHGPTCDKLNGITTSSTRPHGAKAHSSSCLTPGCGKPSFNGQPGDYCSRTCKAGGLSKIASGPTCPTPGCGKPTWNDKPGEYCSKSCKAGGVGSSASGPTCLTPSCGKPTFNGKPGYYCCKTCQMRGGAAGAVAGGRGSPTGTDQPLTQIHTHEAKYKDLQNQFNKKWDPLCGRVPSIQSMWLIHNQSLLDNFDNYCKNVIGNVKLFGAGANPGNQQRRFHRTSMECQSRFRGSFCSSPTCKGCSIMKTGFLKKFLNHAPTWKHYGIGFYSSPSSSYGLSLRSAAAASKFADGAVFVCKVGVGVADITDTTAALPHGTHSRVASSTTPNPDDSELVAFEEAQMVPRYLILF